jgi:hypothetical protein
VVALKDPAGIAIGEVVMVPTPVLELVTVRLAGIPPASGICET